MCHASHEKLQTTYDWRNGTTKSGQSLGENETYKYMDILEHDTIKQVEMKTRKLLETNSLADTSSKE